MTTTTIVHRTPGLLDPRSLTTMGMSAKPSTTSPIGQFGTGLKYALAGLLRIGADVSIWIGREHWQFELSTTQFRGADFQQVVTWRRTWGGMRRHKILLPFTTQLGPHWEPWMLFRELEANTRDERGRTLSVGPDAGGFWAHVDDAGQYQNVRPDDDHTLIVVTHPAYAKAWESRGDVFLAGATGPEGATGQTLQVLPGPSQRLFYRGMRVLDLSRPSTRTWNILAAQPLTEDRTLHEGYARSAVALHTCRSDDEELVRDVLLAGEGAWEFEMEWPHWVRPSYTFRRVFEDEHPSGSRVLGYMGAWAPPEALDERPFWERRGHAWQLSDDVLLDAAGREVLRRPESLTQDDWSEVAGTLIMAARAVADGECPTCHQRRAPPPPRQGLCTDLYGWGVEHVLDPVPVGEDGWCVVCEQVVDWFDCPGPPWMRELDNLTDDPAHGSGMTAAAFADHVEDLCEEMDPTGEEEPSLLNGGLCHTCSRPVVGHDPGVHNECTMPEQERPPSPLSLILTHRDSGLPVTFPVRDDDDVPF